jgi:hypothetical protein
VRPTAIDKGGCGEASHGVGLGKRPGRSYAVSGHEIDSKRDGESRGTKCAGWGRGEGWPRWAGRATGRASGGREQVSRVRHTLQVGASSTGGSGEAECGARRLDERTPVRKHYLNFIGNFSGRAWVVKSACALRPYLSLMLSCMVGALGGVHPVV